MQRKHKDRGATLWADGATYHTQDGRDGGEDGNKADVQVSVVPLRAKDVHQSDALRGGGSGGGDVDDRTQEVRGDEALYSHNGPGKARSDSETEMTSGYSGGIVPVVCQNKGETP